MPRPRYKRTPTEPAEREQVVPVVLPHVVMTIAEDGTMTVSVDGKAHEPEGFAPPWRREDFARVLDQLTEQHRAPVRVEVREADGSVFTDIITPGKHRPNLKPDSVPAFPTAAARELGVLNGEGFVPGEDVAIAIVISHSDAAPDGTARTLLTPDQLANSPTREVILLGRVSGTLSVGHPQ